MEENKKVKKISIGAIFIILFAIFLIVLVAGLVGGMLISGKNFTEIFSKVKTETREASKTEEIKDAVDIEFNNVENKDAKYIEVIGKDENGNISWTYKTQQEKNTTGKYPVTEKIGIINDKVILNESGTLIALNMKNGEKLWTNTDYKGFLSKVESDDEGNIYLSGQKNSALFVMNSDGKTLKNIKKFSDELETAVGIKIEDDVLTLLFREIGKFEDETGEFNHIINININDLVNTSSNKEKVVKPYFDYQQFMENAVLDKDGNVTIKFKADSDFAKKYGEKYKVANNISKLYFEGKGNGGYFDFIMITNDNKVKLISGEDIIENKAFEVKDINVSNADFVFSTESVDAHDYGIMNKNGEIVYGAYSPAYLIEPIRKTEATTTNTKKYTQQELEKMALDYYEKKNNYRPSNVASIVNKDGTISIQLYDSLSDHNSTADWYTIDPNTAVGTNIMGEKIDLNDTL